MARGDRPPLWLLYLTLVLVVASWIPLVLIARARTTKHSYTRILLLPDMVYQHKFKAQAPNPLFADGRADRRPPEGTVARGQAEINDHLHRGIVNGQWATTFPMPVTAAMMRRGHERFDIYCAPCHGYSGDGRGSVAQRADQLQEGTWVPPSSYHTDLVRSRPLGHIFNTITNGIRNMPAYGPQIPEQDRWAIVLYVRALQLSQDAPIDDVPPEIRQTLR